MGYTYTNSRDQTYHLNKQDSKVKGDRIFTHHFFSPDLRPDTDADMPDGYEVVENPRNGFPVLRKKR